jgi:hypothetical protein
MSIYSEHALGYLTDDEFKQAVRDEAWLDKVREAESDRDDEDTEEGED